MKETKIYPKKSLTTVLHPAIQLLNSLFVGYEEFCRSRRALSTSAFTLRGNTLLDLHNSLISYSASFNNCQLLKTGSLDNAIREFSLAKPSWYMSHYTMTYKNGELMREFLGLFVSYCSLFNNYSMSPRWI